VGKTEPPVILQPFVILETCRELRGGGGWSNEGLTSTKSQGNVRTGPYGDTQEKVITKRTLNGKGGKVAGHDVTRKKKSEVFRIRSDPFFIGMLLPDWDKGVSPWGQKSTETSKGKRKVEAGAGTRGQKLGGGIFRINGRECRTFGQALVMPKRKRNQRQNLGVGKNQSVKDIASHS